MVQMMTQAEIRKYLKSLIQPGPARARGGLTLHALGRHMGIPDNTMEWLARKDTARIGIERQRHFSKIIALYESGYLTTKMGGYKNLENIIVPVENPKVRLKYQVQFGPKGPSLKAVDRPKLPSNMPSLKSLLGR